VIDAPLPVSRGHSFKMAEENGTATEEEGFKFVDKRKISDAPAPESEPEASTAELNTEAAVDAEDDVVDSDEGDLGIDSAYGIVSYAIGLLSMSAWQFLGLIADPKTGKANRDLRQARIAIDCVAGIVDALERNSGAVDPKTMGDLKRVLNDLRLNFVTQSNMQGSSN